ncbi:MAG: LysR family transcriptional regulator, partial [Alcaligenaceae bacterium]
MRYELTDLRVFLAIAQAKSLTGGASNMHLTAPSASYRLKNLEQAMGVPLFERTQKGMSLTPAGMTVLRFAQTILGNVDRLQSEMMRHTNRSEGQLKVFANSSTLNSLPAALSRFLAAYPNVNVDLEESLSEETVKAVLDGRADIGLVAGPIETRDLESITYSRDELLFIVPLRHPLGLHEKISLESALSHDLVAIGRKSSNFLFLQQKAE